MEAPEHGFIKGLLVPGLPQPLLAPEQNEGWARLRRAFDAAREEIAACKPDLLLIYSVMWPSVIGHQIQSHPNPKWVHVDELFHDLGSMPYEFRIDSEFSEAYQDAARERGLTARCVAYDVKQPLAVATEGQAPVSMQGLGEELHHRDGISPRLGCAPEIAPVSSHRKRVML